jgi:hypothetical protein
MARRLSERFQVGERVEIGFKDQGGLLRWQSGVIIAHQPPGLWVETGNGMRWFVTNGRRIRLPAEGREP